MINMEDKSTNKNDNHNKYTGDIKDIISFTKFLVKELDIKLYNNIIYFKDGIGYSSNQIKLRRKIANYLELKTNQDNEVISQMRKYAEYIEPNTKFKVLLKNGLIDNGKIVNLNNEFSPFFLDITYNKNAYDKYVDSFLNFICCDSNDIRLVIEEILGHILLVDKFPHKIFFLIGNGSNGKSTFVEMISNFVGELASHIDISAFNDGTSIVSLIGKLVNISDDVDCIYLEKSMNLKTMASGNTISTRAIYSTPVEIKNTATLIFTANEPPIFKDKTNGIIRRLVVIPFNNVVKERIYNLDELLSTDNAKSYLLNLALNGIKRIYDNNLELSKSDTIDKATIQYHLDNDSVLAFINETTPNLINVPIKNIYDNYIKYANSIGKTPVSINMFSRRLNNIGYTTTPRKINGDSVRVIVCKK